MIFSINKYVTWLLLMLASLGCTDSVDPMDYATYESIKTVAADLYSIDEDGNFPVYQNMNPDRLGIGIYPDSTVTEREALIKPGFIDYVNYMESINFYTVYDFNMDHPSGSNINDILIVQLPDGDDQYLEKPYNTSLVTKGSNFRLAAVPQNDSLQFRVTGRITDEGPFEENTPLIILN